MFPILETGPALEEASLPAFVVARDGLYLRKRSLLGLSQHTALLGEWAIGKTTLLMHWRRRRDEAGDRVVLTMAYPQSRDDFLAALAGAVAAEADGGWTAKVDLEVGLDVGLAEARLRKPVREVEKELRATLRRAARAGDRHTLVVMVDDVDLVATPGDTFLQLRATALELYATDIAIAFVVSASPGLFGSIRGAHEPLVRFFEPITLGALAPAAAVEAITRPLAETGVSFDDDVLMEIVELSGGRPYYLQKLAYFASDAAERGRVGRAEFAVAFEHAFASVSQEIFAARWAAMAPVERHVVSVVASETVARTAGEIEGEAASLGIAPPPHDRRFVGWPPAATSIGWRTASAGGTRSTTACSGDTWSCRRASGSRSGFDARVGPVSTPGRGRGVPGRASCRRPQPPDHRLVSGEPGRVHAVP